MLWDKEKRFIQQGRNSFLFYKIEYDARMYAQYSCFKMLRKRKRGIIIKIPDELNEWIKNNQEYIKARTK